MARTRRKAKGTGKGNSVENARRRSGRPTKEEGGTRYRPEFCAQIIEHAKDGWSETELAVNVCGVTRAAMRNWGKKYPEFGDALEQARDHAKAWWETKGRVSLRTQGFNINLYNKLLSCRFREDYSERMTIEGDDEKPIVHEIRRTIVKAPVHKGS